MARVPFFILLTGHDADSMRPLFTVIDQKGDLRFAELKKQQAERTIAPLAAHIRVRENSAEIHATDDMLIERYTDEDGGEERWKFKDEVVVAKADEQGRIFIEQSKPGLARRILRDLRRLNPRASLDPAGLMLPEEEPEPIRPRSPGRPTREQMKRRVDA